MIRRSPAEIYIKYLLLHPKGYTNEQIRDALLFAKLDFLGNWYLNRLRQQLERPKPFYPQDRRHKESVQFLFAHDVYDLFYPDATVKAAFRLLTVPRVKEWIEVMLTCRLPCDEIADHIVRFRGVHCLPQDIKRYNTLFWNIDLLDVMELRELVDFRIDQLMMHPDPEIAAQAEAAKKSIYRDPLRKAVNMPISPAAIAVVLLDLGIQPLGINVNKLLEHNNVLAGLRLSEALMVSGSKDAYRAKAYTEVVEGLARYKEQSTSAHDQMRKQLQELAIRTDSAEMPTVQQLTGGNYTQNLEPERKNDELPTTNDDPTGEGEEFTGPGAGAGG